MEKKYVASIEISEQVTEDSWRMTRYNLEVNGSTTISEIEAWARERKFKGLTDIQVSELETLKTNQI